MEEFYRKLQKMELFEIENFQYKSAKDVITTCTKLKELNRHLESIRLYEKFESEIVLSEFEVVGLITMIEVCQDISDESKMLKFAVKLKKLAPNHSKIVEMNKKFLFQ